MKKSWEMCANLAHPYTQLCNTEENIESIGNILAHVAACYCCLLYPADFILSGCPPTSITAAVALLATTLQAELDISSDFVSRLWFGSP